MSLVQLVANHTVRVTITPGQAAIPATKDTPAVPAKRPVFTDVQKGSMFLIDAETAADLVRMGAASYYQPTAPSSVVVAAVANAAVSAPSAEEPRKRQTRKAKNPATEPTPEGDDDDDQV
jgi:hypothetical protein